MIIGGYNYEKDTYAEKVQEDSMFLPFRVISRAKEQAANAINAYTSAQK